MFGFRYIEAIQTYRRLKTRWPNVVSEVIVGVPTVADDIWAMLNMYCNELSGRRLSDSSSFFAMTVSDSELTKHCSRLTAACMQVINLDKHTHGYHRCDVIFLTASKCRTWVTVGETFRVERVLSCVMVCV